MSDVLDYKCPHCGGNMEFDVKLQKMKCPYCDSVMDMSELQGKDAALDTEIPDLSKQEDRFDWKVGSDDWTDSGMSVYTCKSCGGEILSDETTVATACPYCGNPVVLTGRVSGVLKPDVVIPFRFDKQAAKDKLKAFVASKKFAPAAFQSDSRLEEIKGVYVPYWLFDSDVDAMARFLATRVRHWSDREYDYTETSHYGVYRAGVMRFENIPVDASTKMPDDLMESIEPFDFKDAVDFQTAYLSGFLADKYNVTMEESLSRANERLKNSANDALRNTVGGYATVTLEDSCVNTSNGQSKYALYPVWLLNTTYKNQTYTFAMNGQTGKLVGNLPADKGKLAALFGALSVGIGAAAFLIGTLIGFF